MKGNSNRGMSYVEIIIVFAIGAIMIALVTISIGTVSRTNVNRTAEKVQSLVNQARVSALTHGTANGYLNIAVEGNSVYGYVGESVSDTLTVREKGEKICPSDVQIIVTGGTVNGAVTQLQFQQSTGGIVSTNPAPLVTVMVKKDNFESSTFQVYKQTGKIKAS